MLRSDANFVAKVSDAKESVWKVIEEEVHE